MRFFTPSPCCQCPPSSSGRETPSVTGFLLTQSKSSQVQSQNEIRQSYFNGLVHWSSYNTCRSTNPILDLFAVDIGHQLVRQPPGNNLKWWIRRCLHLGRMLCPWKRRGRRTPFRPSYRLRHRKLHKYLQPIDPTRKSWGRSLHHYLHRDPSRSMFEPGSRLLQFLYRVLGGSQLPVWFHGIPRSLRLLLLHRFRSWKTESLSRWSTMGNQHHVVSPTGARSWSAWGAWRRGRLSSSMELCVFYPCHLLCRERHLRYSTGLVGYREYHWGWESLRELAGTIASIGDGSRLCRIVRLHRLISLSFARYLLVNISERKMSEI